MKRKYLNSPNTPRKKRKFNVNDVNYDGNNSNNNSNNNTKMVCVICLSEMPSPSLHEHYSKYHNELLVSTTSNFANVIQKCKDNNIIANNNDNKNNKLLYGDNDKFRSKLELLHKEEENKKNLTKKTKNKKKTKTKNKNKTKTKNKPITFNVPRFELNMDNNENNDNKNKNKNKKDNNNNDVDVKETGELIPNITTSARPLVIRDNDNEYESIIESLRKFENNSHELSYLLSQDSLNISTVSQCKLLIKILFEQLWNARKICDEQILFIKYINMIDIGNRMQISFLLNQLKQNHNNIYHDLYQQLQSNPNWQTWKNVRFNDKKINYLRQNIHKIKQNHQELISNNNNNNNNNNIQLQTISNLKNKQSAAIQSYDLSTNNNNNNNNKNENNFFTDYEKKMRSSALSSVDLSAALSSVDCINAPSHAAPRPDIVDLIDDNDNDNDDEEWILIIKKLLNEFKSCMDLREINDKLESLRYCSEFDVLNDMLCINKVNKSKEIKLRFCHYFGNLSDWSFKRLIKWCQTNKFYQICQKIRSKKINGKQFIDIVTNITSVRRFFNNLTSPQIIQIYNRINHYFEDALSIL